MSATAYSCVLAFREGNSDKVYKLWVYRDVGLSVADQYRVGFAYGRRGAALKEGEKTSRGVSSSSAVALYEAVRREKLDKGYWEVKDAADNANWRRQSAAPPLRAVGPSGGTMTAGQREAQAAALKSAAAVERLRRQEAERQEAVRRLAARVPVRRIPKSQDPFRAVAQPQAAKPRIAAPPAQAPAPPSHTLMPGKRKIRLED